MTAGELERTFRVEQFRDYLALEAGTSPHTVSNYVRDVRRLVGYAAGKGAHHPEDVTSVQLREFVYALKDLGLAPATIEQNDFVAGLEVERDAPEGLDAGERLVDAREPE